MWLRTSHWFSAQFWIRYWWTVTFSGPTGELIRMTSTSAAKIPTITRRHRPDSAAQNQWGYPQIVDTAVHAACVKTSALVSFPAARLAVSNATGVVYPIDECRRRRL